VTIDLMPELRDKNADDLEKTTGVPEELRGMRPEDLEHYVEVLDAHLRTIHIDEDNGELREKTPAEQKAFDYGLKLRDIAIRRIEEHRAVQEVFRRRPKAVESAMFNAGRDRDDAYGDVRRLTNAEARDRALRHLDDRNNAAHLSAPQKEQVERQVRVNTDIARRILVTENEDYREAWMKLVTDPRPILTPEESRAVQAWVEYRNMAEGTSSAGGFGIPVFIDPSIILTAQESGNPFLTLCRQETVNTNAWKGVSSAGVSWSFDTEASAVSDDSPTLAQPSVTVFMARGFIPYSIELEQDYPAFANEMSRLLSEGYDELLVDKFSRGSGTNEPKGILTALDANTNVEVLLTTAGSFGEVDLYAVWKAVPQKYRRKSAWMMNVGVNNSIRRFGTANVFHAYTENLPAEWADMLFGRGVYESPYFSDFTATTAHQNVAVVGDWSNYLIARRGGMSVELIPQIFDTSTGRPTGQRGWFGYARIGGNSVNDLGFRLLNQT
jgi:HK97 family phage major capsid protein